MCLYQSIHLAIIKMNLISIMEGMFWFGSVWFGFCSCMNQLSSNILPHMQPELTGNSPRTWLQKWKIDKLEHFSNTFFWYFYLDLSFLIKLNFIRIKHGDKFSHYTYMCFWSVIIYWSLAKIPLRHLAILSLFQLKIRKILQE